MQEEPDLIACDCCDALYSRPRLRTGQLACCDRCGAELDRAGGRARQTMLPLSIACLILLCIANAFPIVAIEVQGQSSETTLIGAVLALVGEGEPVVAVLVLGTTILFPFLYLAVLTMLTLPVPGAWIRGRAGWLVRAVRASRPWGMIEVFMLGILVAIVKLASMATIVPGVALWAFVAVTVMLTAILGFDLRAFWFDAPAPRESLPADRPAVPAVVRSGR